jgi:hypothetical protein
MVPYYWSTIPFLSAPFQPVVFQVQAHMFHVLMCAGRSWVGGSNGFPMQPVIVSGSLNWKSTYLHW